MELTNAPRPAQKQTINATILRFETTSGQNVALVDSPDQGVTGIAVSDVTLCGASWR